MQATESATFALYCPFSYRYLWCRSNCFVSHLAVLGALPHVCISPQFLVNSVTIWIRVSLCSPLLQFPTSPEFLHLSGTSFPSQMLCRIGKKPLWTEFSNSFKHSSIQLNRNCWMFWRMSSCNAICLKDRWTLAVLSHNLLCERSWTNCIVLLTLRRQQKVEPQPIRFWKCTKSHCRCCACPSAWWTQSAKTFSA